MLSRGSIIVLLLCCLPVAIQAQELQLADSLTAIGREHDDRGRYRQAEFYLSRALEIYRDYSIPDTTRFIDISIDYVDPLYQQTKYEDALQELRTAHKLAAQTKDTSRLIKIENFRGLVLKKKNHFKEALEQYQRALNLAARQHDSLMVATINDNIGGLNYRLGNYEESLEYHRKALDLFEEVGTDMNLSITLNNIGLTYYRISMYDRAREYLTHSLSLARGLDNALQLATTYDNLGKVHHELGNYDQALIAYQKALQNIRKTGNPLKEGYAMVNLGNLYSTLGDPQKSLEYYRESLVLMNKYNITSPTHVSPKYTNIATRLFELGQVEKARKNYQKALELVKKTGNTSQIASSYLYLAKLDRSRGELAKARAYAIRSKQIADSTGLKSLQARTNISLGRIEWAEQNYSSAIRYFRRAYRQGQDLSDQQVMTSLSFLAYTFDDIESDSAVYYGQKLVEIIEESRENVGELSAHKSGFFEGYADFYVDVASWILKYHDNEAKAYELVEASKARTLLDELAKASQNLDRNLPEEVRIKKQRLLEEIETLHGRIDTSSNLRAKQELEKDLRDKELEYAAYMNQVQSENPHYKSLEYPSPVTLEGAQTLVDEETALLEYAFADDELLIFLVTSEQVRVESIPLPSDNIITRQVEEFRDQILAHQPEHQIRDASTELVQRLIEPFYKELSGYGNLIIIPDDALTYLPFEALTVGSQYLVEQFSIKYAPSMTTFSLLKTKGDRRSYSKELLAVAGSDFEGTTNPLNRGRALPPLPATLAEVDSIAGKFTTAEVLKKGNFDEQFIRERLNSNFRFVHLATHGIIDENNPNLSGLALSSAPEQASGKDDGMLRSSEIYQLNMNADMVVLSACNTGLGKVVNGEGLLGLQRSFFYAGVPTVSVSLWNVYDRSTSHFMNQFYSSLLGRMKSGRSDWSWDSLLRWVGWDKSVPFGDMAPAMRQAKLTMMEHPLYHHPVYWAPFIVVGR